MKLNKNEESYIRGYATALQDIMFQLTGENTCGKSYDPVEFDSKELHSYAFNLKDGGRHHPLEDYNSVDEITTLMLGEATQYCKDNQ